MGKDFWKNGKRWLGVGIRAYHRLGLRGELKMQISLVLITLGFMQASGFAYPGRFVGPCLLERSGDQNRHPALSLWRMPISTFCPKEGAQWAMTADATHLGQVPHRPRRRDSAGVKPEVFD